MVNNPQNDHNSEGGSRNLSLTRSTRTNSPVGRTNDPVRISVRMWEWKCCPEFTLHGALPGRRQCEP